MWKWHVECCKLNVGFLNCCRCVGELRGGRGSGRNKSQGGDNQDDAYKLCDLNEEQQQKRMLQGVRERQRERERESGRVAIACVIEQVNAGGSCCN